MFTRVFGMRLSHFVGFWCIGKYREPPSKVLWISTTCISKTPADTAFRPLPYFTQLQKPSFLFML